MTHSADSTPRISDLDSSLKRYSRQVLFDKIGEEGQRKLADSKVTLVGCGALGTVLANTLVRAGVGFVRICDRDFIEEDNLQRQVLFDHDDIDANLPKAQAAARKLARINPHVEIDPVVTDVNPTNIEKIAEDADLLLDGTDNFETRFLINDLAIKTDRPWVYGAVIGATGLVMAVLPRETPCLRCVFEEAPPPEMNPTCDTAGVLASAVNVVASLQAIEAIKILTGRLDEVNRKLAHIDVWTGRFVNMNVSAARESANCPVCKRGEYDYLSGKHASSATTLCGRDAVQINVAAQRPIDFAKIATKLSPISEGRTRHNSYMLKARVDGFDLTVFPDGRAIIKGTDDAGIAKSVYAKYVGA